MYVPHHTHTHTHTHIHTHTHTHKLYVRHTSLCHDTPVLLLPKQYLGGGGGRDKVSQ